MKHSDNSGASLHARHSIPLRLERWHRLCVYGCVAVLLITGVVWLVAHYFLRPVGEFGEAVHPLEPWSMKLHGACAMAMLFFVGSLLNVHIRRALKAGRNKYSGWGMMVVLGALTATGYGLYYLASESNRPVWSAMHWVIGLALPVALVLHIVLGRRTRSAAQR